MRREECGGTIAKVLFTVCLVILAADVVVVGASVRLGLNASLIGGDDPVGTRLGSRPRGWVDTDADRPLNLRLRSQVVLHRHQLGDLGCDLGQRVYG